MSRSVLKSRWWPTKLLSPFCLHALRSLNLLFSPTIINTVVKSYSRPYFMIQSENPDLRENPELQITFLISYSNWGRSKNYDIENRGPILIESAPRIYQLVWKTFCWNFKVWLRVIDSLLSKDNPYTQHAEDKNESFLLPMHKTPKNDCNNV